jgi:hypothetical protein
VLLQSSALSQVMDMPRTVPSKYSYDEKLKDVMSVSSLTSRKLLLAVAFSVVVMLLKTFIKSISNSMKFPLSSGFH